jgi:regulator of RNase E activity RraA
VTVTPGDIIVAGEDGVVAVPQEKAPEVLKRALEIDARESKMVPLIRQYRSLRKVVEMFNRI